jgi:hypothetical protein
MKRSDHLRVLVECRMPTKFSQVLTLLAYAGGSAVSLSQKASGICRTVRFESQPEGFWHMQDSPIWVSTRRLLAYAGESDLSLSQKASGICRRVRFEFQPEGFWHMQEGPLWVSSRRLLTFAEYIGFESQQDTVYFDSAFRAFTQYIKQTNKRESTLIYVITAFYQSPVIHCSLHLLPFDTKWSELGSDVKYIITNKYKQKLAHGLLLAIYICRVSALIPHVEVYLLSEKISMTKRAPPLCKVWSRLWFLNCGNCTVVWG